MNHLSVAVQARNLGEQSSSHLAGLRIDLMPESVRPICKTRAFLMGSLCSFTLMTKAPGGASGAGFLPTDPMPISASAARSGKGAADPISLVPQEREGRLAGQVLDCGASARALA